MVDWEAYEKHVNMTYDIHMKTINLYMEVKVIHILNGMNITGEIDLLIHLTGIDLTRLKKNE
ncbi:hypothetical protein ACJX0J_018008, partial [Zea mays]